MCMCGVVLQTLANEVAHYLGMELGKIKIKRFADGEVYVQIQVCEHAYVLLACMCVQGLISVKRGARMAALATLK